MKRATKHQWVWVITFGAGLINFRIFSLSFVSNRQGLEIEKMIPALTYEEQIDLRDRVEKAETKIVDMEAKAKLNAEKDLEFLRELLSRLQPEDTTQMDYARQMIKDWIAELEAMAGEM